MQLQPACRVRPFRSGGKALVSVDPAGELVRVVLNDGQTTAHPVIHGKNATTPKPAHP